MIPKIRNIVVGVESVREADPVLLSALDLARQLKATLHVVHGFVLTDPLLDAYARAGYLGENTIANFGEDLQAALQSQMQNLAGGSDVRAKAIAGPPVSAILEVAEEVDADLIVVGATRHGAFPLSLLGSTVRGVLRRAHVPVLMMRSGTSVTPQKVLAPTDLSPLSAAAFDWGTALAGPNAAALTVRLLLVINRSLLQMPLEQRLLDDVAHRELQEFRARVDHGNARVDEAVRRGEPASEIVAEANAWGADLIVLGTHSRKGFERLLVGSVAEATIRNAPCNVLVVPPVQAGGDSGASNE